MTDANANRDPRVTAFQIALARHAPDERVSILQKHPDQTWRRAIETAEGGASGEPGASLADLLWAELEHHPKDLPAGLGQPAEPGSPVEAMRYWLSRRYLQHWQRWQEAVAALPGYWRQLAQAPTEQLQFLGESLGARMIALGLLRHPPQMLLDEFRVLGKRKARRVVDLMDALRETKLPRPLVQLWLEQFRRAGAHYRGENILLNLGLDLLTTLYQRLSASQRDALCAIARSDFQRIFSQTPASDLCPPASQVTVETMIADCLADSDRTER